MQQEDVHCTRRAFVKSAVGALALASGSAGPDRVAALAQQPRAGEAQGAARPRIGCVSWNFHDLSAGASPEESIDIMGEIGFEGTELILSARQDIKGLWTDDKIAQIKSKLERNKLAVSQFAIFQPVVEGLTSTNTEERERNLGYFEDGCRIAEKLGAPIVDIVAPWPRELSSPGVGYLPRYYELRNPKPGAKFHIDIAPGFDWEKLWLTYIETTRACLERAKAHGLRFTIENHTHTMIHDATAFLRLWDAIRDPALGFNLDIGWVMLQREYPPVAIYRAKDHLMNLHTRDIDGLMHEFVHVGEGVMDFKAVADALKAIGFQGFLSIEQDRHPGDMKTTCRRYLSMMKEYLA